MSYATPSEIERLVYYMPSIAARAENDWSRSFAQSIVKQCRRRNWRPSPKQLSVMRGLVTDLFTQGSNEGGECDVIE
ncbi:hypothetical protein SAMN05444000_12647 [Shimia gijangensis]|uniref:Uncharacterized protein n=1 Tax=Shimia gijangensis TaxID=1470563 RepID=A0A1M6RU24_9RHOB|nr:hypothetical protein [Shimia gijangensis]SHK35963.1 hypothetical protein SAMN05444000_12647 [Shimia gijangensis]